MVREGFEGGGEAQGFVEPVSVFGEQFRGGVAHLLVDEAALGDPNALLTPAGDGHFLNEQALGGGGGLVLGEEGGVELVESVFDFVEEADGGGGEVGRGEAVARGVGGGAGLAFGGDGAVGLFPLAREAARRRLDDMGWLPFKWVRVGVTRCQFCEPA